MDFSTFITEHGPALGAAAVGILAAGWALFKAIAPLTKSKADDAFIAKHGKTVDDALDKVDGE